MIQTSTSAGTKTATTSNIVEPSDPTADEVEITYLVKLDGIPRHWNN
jgi:hypothetical protein